MKTNQPDIDEILAGLANYIVQSITLEPTSVEYIKLNQRQAKAQIEAYLQAQILEARIDELERIDGLAYGTEYGQYQQRRLDELKALNKEGEK